MNVTEARNQVRGLQTELVSLIPSIREVNRELTLILALRDKLGLTGPIWDFVTVFQQIRLSAEMATRGIYMAYAAAGPVGWVIGAGTAALGLFTMMSIRRPRY